MSEGAGRINEKIRSFKRKYYLNLFIRGTILSLSILTGYFLLASLLEYNLWLGSAARSAIFISFFGIAAFCVIRFLNEPLQWWLARRGMSDEQTARLIGTAMPSVKDRLLNLIQLIASGKNSELAYASIRQKSLEFEPLSFESVIDYQQNKKYLCYLAIPAGIVFFILLFNQNILTESTNRIVHFRREFSPKAPFDFIIDRQSLTAFYNEDFTLNVRLQGEAVPANAYIVYKNHRYKLEQAGKGEFRYTLEKIQQPFQFQIEAAGFFSDPHTVTIINRPEITQFHVELEYPRYLNRKNERINNAGNLEIPEGTLVRWKLNTAHTRNAGILFSNQDRPFEFKNADGQYFTYSNKFVGPVDYEIVLENEKSRNKDRIAYRIDVVKDQYPQVAVSNYKDSILYKRVILGGMVSDDHGVTRLALHFKIVDDKREEVLSRSVNIPLTGDQLQQNFFYHWSLDSLKLKPGYQLEYHLQVWDNDGVNGRKSTRSGTYTFVVPTEGELIKDIGRSQEETLDKIDQGVNQVNKLRDQLEQAHQKLKGKQSLDWQDKKMLEDIIRQEKSLNEMLEKLKEQNKLLEDKKDAFTEQNERIRQKAEQIKKLMDELLDDETKKLFEELQKLLEENTDISQVQKLLDKLNRNTNNLEKELERTLELFKQLQYEFKLDQTAQQLKKQIEKQQSLLEKTENLENDGRESDKKNDRAQKGQRNKDGKTSDSDSQQPDSQKLAEEQQQVNQDFQQIREELEELERLGDELNLSDEDLPSEEESQEVEQQLEQSQQMLQQNQPSKAVEPQRKALDKMQEMQQRMESMQQSMSMEIDMQNLESLRHILHGLVKLSFDQERLMKEFNELQQNDPRFNTIAQQQLKLKDDAKVLEDSLIALGKRDPMMGKFINKEIGELNNHLDRVIEANKERRRPQASSEMQMTMTSINNLALMLDDHFDMMMQMMANARPSMKKSKQKGQKPSLSQMQQQLNERIQQLKSSGKTGRELSEELAEMAAEQERIRRALQEMQEKMKKEGQVPGGDLPSKMEQTEMDLVNKQLTEQLIRRQKEIMTRLLEAEQSMREQDLDDERKGETAKDYEKEIPKAFEEYLRLKEKEVELLKTVPPKLYPYYKREVSEYFKRMGTNK